MLCAVGCRLWLIAVLAAFAFTPSRAARAADTSAGSSRASGPARRPRPCTPDELRRRGWNIGGERARCVPPAPPPPSEPGRAISFFALPWNGLALKLGAHLELVDPDRGGLSAEPGLSWYWERQLEIGVGARLLWLQTVSVELFGDERDVLDRAIMPRLLLSYGGGDGFWRFHLSGGYGPTWMRAEGGNGALATVERTVWSYGAGMGFSAGVFHLELQLLGYLREAEAGYIVAPGTPGEPIRRGSPGTALSIGFVFPIALAGASSPASEPATGGSGTPPSLSARGASRR